MATNIRDDGSFEIIYGQKYTGINVQAPPNLIADTDAVDINNFFVRNAQITSRPQVIPWTNSIGGTNVLTGVGTFLSPSRIYHTFAFDSAGGLWNLNSSAPPSTLSKIATLSTLQSTNPVSWRVFNSVLYWVNGSQSMGAWDGQLAAGGIITYGVGAGGSGYAVGDTGTVTTGGANATYKVLTVVSGAVASFTITNSGSGYSTSSGNATSVTTGGGDGTFTVNIFSIGIGPSQQVATVTTTSTGDTPLGARYIDVLDQQVILANTNGNASDGPFTIRWSATGLPTVFDPTVNINAGFNIFIDFADQISGFMGLGRVGYIFHRTGITEMAPTGVGTAPFDFNHIWNSQDGTGGIFPNTVAQYGQVGAFVSTENIYSISNYQFNPIGGTSRDAIFADFNTALTGINSPLPIGAILPGYEDDFVYLTYQIYIPLSVTGPTVMWQYSFEDNTWERYTISHQLVTGIPTFCISQ